MNKIQEKVKSAAKTMISKMVSGDTREWPPTCSFFAYQPVRPELTPEVATERNAECEKS